MVTPISNYELNALVTDEVSSAKRPPGNGEPGEASKSVLESLQRLRKVAGETGSRGQDIQSLEQAAGEFESLLIAQILRSFREGGSGGWLGMGSPEGPNPAMDLAESQLARVLGQNGALGLLKTLQQGLREAGSRTTATNAADEPPPAQSRSRPATDVSNRPADGL